jgi:phosphate transport system substrate-binding protein
MKQSVRLVASLALSAGFVAGAAMAADITGAGATFPYPLYAKWATSYKATPATI